MVRLVHLVFLVGLSLWSPDEINDAYNQAQFAISYWNAEYPAVQWKLADMTVMAMTLDAMNFDQAWRATDALPGNDYHIYVTRGLTMYGYSRPQYVVVLYSGMMRGVLIHEMGHSLGATDHAEWTQQSGWVCADIDPMCRATATPQLGKDTLQEIAKGGGS